MLLCPMHHRLPLLRAHRFIKVLPTLYHFQCAFGLQQMQLLTPPPLPPVNPASAMTFELSGEITVWSRAAGLLQNQLGTKMSAGLVRRLSWLNPLPASYLTLMPARQNDSASISLMLLCLMTTSLSLTSCCTVPQRI